MKGITALPSVFLLSTLSSLNFAQDISVTLGEAPFVLNGEPTELAEITITENAPDALSSGFFALFFPENPDQRLTFQAASSVTGNANGMVVQGALGASALVVEVDAEDDRI